MTAFEVLHEKYARGDSLSNKELQQLSDFVGELAPRARQARSIVGSATVHYLNMVEIHLSQLMKARGQHRTDEPHATGDDEEQMASPGAGMR